ncbi:MAG: cell division protein FtsQ/DivIB [Colwellia sp.]
MQAKKSKKIMQETQSTWYFGVGLAFFILVVFGLISLSWKLTDFVIGEENSPVTAVKVTGEMPYTLKADVLSAIEDVDMGNFFQVDVNTVQQKVQALPWVYSVAVRKQWPSELKIYVVDQKPVALWNGDFILNEFGVAFQANTERLQQRLPQFYGPEGSEILALENYINLSGLLAFKSLGINELLLSERFSWQLTLSDGVLLNLGREDRIVRIQRFMDLYPTIKSQAMIENSSNKNKKSRRNKKKKEKKVIDYIDLRYDTGLAVGWKSMDNTKQSSTYTKQELNSNV